MQSFDHGSDSSHSEINVMVCVPETVFGLLAVPAGKIIGVAHADAVTDLGDVESLRYSRSLAVRRRRLLTQRITEQSKAERKQLQSGFGHGLFG